MSQAWSEAKKHLAGGVNSPVRAFKAVGGEPVFISRGVGPHLFDIDDNRYIDFCLSWGALLFGHADAQTIQAVQAQAQKGTSFGAATPYETALAREIKKAFPRMEKIRFTSSGTEAAMSAIRLARGVTQRDRILKFEGCYHGHSDGLLVKAGSGLATFGSPDSDGVPQAIAGLTTVLPYNDIEAVERFFKTAADDLACVIVEPVAANMGVVPGDPKFLQALRALTAKNGAQLIFDEVITGYRLCFGGAQHIYGIKPDITVLGKIIGGGLPIGAFGAEGKLMDALSPDGRVYQAGTLSGNPLSMAAGLSVLSRLSPEFYKQMEQRAGGFLHDAAKILQGKRKKAVIRSQGSMFTIFFADRAPENFHQVSACDSKEYGKFFNKMLESGVYLPPSAFESCFVSQAHGEQDLDKTLEAIKAY